MERLCVSPHAMFIDIWPGWGVFLGTNKPNNKTVYQWVSVAERVARDHGGILPCAAFLMKNGYTGLQRAVSKRPDLFSHIEIDKQRKRSEEWVDDACRLAGEHGGVLPCNSWLTKNGFQGIARAIYKKPELFAHIKQDRPLRTTKELVAIAERLAIENKGVLPCPSWLHKNGHGRIATAKLKYPEMFDHIEQDSKRGRSPEGWVPVAEELAKQHGGLLPSSKWMQTNGHYGLYEAIFKQPEIFSHIIRQVKHKSPEEWVPIAEAMATDNGGVLQNNKCLIRNGRSGLVHAMKRKPGLFSHIPQERRDNQGRLIPDPR